MLAYDFLYNRCDEDTSDVIQTYLEVMCGSGVSVFDKDGNKLNAIAEAVLVFINICQLSPNLKIKDLFDEFGINSSAHFVFNYEDMDDVLEQLNGEEFLEMEAIQSYFDSPIMASTLIKTYGGCIEGLVTVERILYNFLVDPHKYGYEKKTSLIARLNIKEPMLYAMMSDEFIDRLDKMAKEKEGGYKELLSTSKSRKKYKFKYGEILTDKKYTNDPSVGRDKEMKNLIVALATPNKSAIITGPAGVGKTALVEGLAYRLQKGEVPRIFSDKEILAVTSSQLVQGCSYVGEFEQKIEKFLKNVRKYPELILFMDEIHTAVGTGVGSNGGNDLANILKPYLDRGQIKLIGSTTDYEYEKLINEDGAFKRRFERIKLKEPNDEILKKILLNRIECYENELDIPFLFNLDLRNMIIDSIIEVTNVKKRDQFDYVSNPDLAISILERAFALAIYDGNESVIIKNVIDAIMESERVYARQRDVVVSKLERIIRTSKEEKGTAKVISLQSQIKKSK